MFSPAMESGGRFCFGTVSTEIGLAGVTGWATLDGGRGCGGIYGYGEFGVEACGEVVWVQRGDDGDGLVAVLVAEDAVFGLGGAVDVVVGVGLCGHKPRGEVFREKDLSDV
jgi:hypothetical protein